MKHTVKTKICFYIIILSMSIQILFIIILAYIIIIGTVNDKLKIRNLNDTKALS